jgi:membrane-bound lytic murein transglycosylase D
MNKALYIYASLVTLLLAGVLFFASANKDATVNMPDRELPQTIYAIPLNRPFDFAGEPVPMENFDVRERLDRELTVNSYTHGATLLNIKHMYRYFPMFEAILKEQGVPDDFKYVSVAESNLRNAVSPAGARGIWQLMAPTAIQYGLEINEEVDERYHYEKATIAACKLLKDYYKKFGNWTLAAAGYNMGGPRLGKVREAQGALSFYDLNLNEETSRYIFRLVAIKDILENPRLYGFVLDQEEAYSPLDKFKEIEVKSSIPDLAAFARENGITFRMLKVYNPWLIASQLTNKTGKTYRIKIPLQ